MQYRSTLVLLLLLWFPLMEMPNVNGSILSILEGSNIQRANWSRAGGYPIPGFKASTHKTDPGTVKSDDVFGISLQVEKIFMDAKAKLFISGDQLAINHILLSIGSERFRQCLTDLSVVVNAIKRREEWAVQMIDSFGKPDAGFLNGNNVLHGHFDQCMDVVTGLRFESQFCGAQIGILSVKKVSLVKPRGFLLSMCLPSSCDKKHIQDIINAYMWLNPDISGGAVEVECREKDRTLSSKAIVIICICSIFLCMVLIGTTYDVFCKMKYYLLMEGKDWNSLDDPMAQAITPSAPSKCYLENQRIIDENRNGQPPLYSYKRTDPVPPSQEEKCQLVETLKQIFMSFSAYTNFINLVSTDQPQGSITCINGLRVISLNWIVVFHFIGTRGLGVENFQTYLDKSYEKWSFMLVLASLVAVDTFFAIGGVLVSYLTLKQFAKKEKAITPKFFGHFYLHRIWRLTPAYMLILMTYATLFPYIYNGPGWTDEDFEHKQCQKTWWTNLLYINNFVYSDEMCMEWSWYLANDMQFYLLSPLLFLPMFYYEWRGLVVPLAFLLGNAICTGVITSVNDLPVYQHFEDVPLVDRQVFWTDYYVKPYTRIGPYIVGTITGFLLYKCQLKAHIPKLLVVLGWVVATALALLVVFGLSEHQTDDPLSADVAGLFNSLNRIAWGMSICWVIFACANGYGGIINTILSWKAFVPLAKLSLCFYLIHPAVVTFFYMSRRRMFYLSNVSAMFGIIAVSVLAYAVSVIAYLMYEAPMTHLEKVFKTKGRGTTKK